MWSEFVRSPHLRIMWAENCVECFNGYRKTHSNSGMAPSGSSPETQECGRKMVILHLLAQPAHWGDFPVAPAHVPLYDMRTSVFRLQMRTEEQGLSRNHADLWQQTEYTEAPRLIDRARFNLTVRTPGESLLISPKEEKGCRIHTFMFSVEPIEDGSLQDKWLISNLSEHLSVKEKRSACSPGMDAARHLLGFSLSDVR